MLEPFDQVLADKEFPTLKCDDVVTVIPPRGKSGQQYSKDDMELTRKIASVRIEVERSIQRLKIYRILSNTFHYSLLPEMDKIIQICAVLTNFQSPITNPSSGQPEAGEEADVEGELEEPPESDYDSDDSLNSYNSLDLYD